MRSRQYRQIDRIHVEQKLTRGATVTGWAPVVSFCCEGLYKYDKKSLKATKNTERLKFKDFNICPNILRVNVDVHGDTDNSGIAIALQHSSTGTLKKNDELILQQ